jgi:hypothetical protein
LVTTSIPSLPSFLPASMPRAAFVKRRPIPSSDTRFTWIRFLMEMRRVHEHARWTPDYYGKIHLHPTAKGLSFLVHAQSHHSTTLANSPGVQAIMSHTLLSRKNGKQLPKRAWTVMQFGIPSLCRPTNRVRLPRERKGESSKPQCCAGHAAIPSSRPLWS